MNIINIIDYSILKTMNKGGKFNNEEYIKDALKKYTELNNSKGFTRNENAREYIETLSCDDIDRELLKNIIKKRAYAEDNGYNILLNTKKSLNDELSEEELELIILNTIDQYSLDVVYQCLEQYPKVRRILINSFVDTRYFKKNYGKEAMDKQELSSYYRLLINRIDDYYNILKLSKKKVY